MNELALRFKSEPMPTTYPHLPRAPIREAVLDIGVELAQPVTVADLGSFAESTQSEFPTAEPLKHLNVEVPTTPDALPKVSTQDKGTIYWNLERTRAVQARLDGFSVNQVGSYKDWADLRSEARKHWQAYVEVAHPIRVIRCGLRYINRIEIPGGAGIDTCLRSYAQVPNTLPQTISEYFFRVGFPFEGDQRAHVTQSLEPLPVGVVSEGRALILDIDAFSSTKFDDVGSESIWAEFDALRTIKNRCFFESLTQSKWEEYL